MDDEMHDNDRFEFDGRDNPFVAQLPSVLIAAAAIGLIVLVNVAAPGHTAPGPALPNAVEPRAAPAEETIRSHRPAERATTGTSTLFRTSAQRA